MLPALLVLTAIFALLFLTRVGAARRRVLLQRWPALLFALAAALGLMRGAVWIGLGFAVLAGLAWVLWPSLTRPVSAPVRADPADAQARAALGVGPNASEAEIRQAYRTKMAQAHPDRGGAHNEAARLTAARDRLLKGKKR